MNGQPKEASVAADEPVERSLLVTRERAFLEWRNDTDKFSLSIDPPFDNGDVGIVLTAISGYDGRRRHIHTRLSAEVAQAIKEALDG